MVLRVEDISEIGSDKTDVSQTDILKANDIYDKVNFEASYEISDWSSIFLTIAVSHPIITIEDEGECPSLMMGTLKSVKDDSVKIHEFTGAARWLDEESEMYYEDITSFQVGNHYTNVYQKYFEDQP